ncbi:MAG: hypothetical protein K0R43_3590 [Pseudoduganella sp.]|nr:hypothetical protein [Pseudoduganella sp.]
MRLFFRALCISALFRDQIFTEIKLFLRAQREKTRLVRHNIKPGIVHRRFRQGLCFRNCFCAGKP